MSTINTSLRALQRRLVGCQIGLPDESSIQDVSKTAATVLNPEYYKPYLLSRGHTEQEVAMACAVMTTIRQLMLTNKAIAQRLHGITQR